jgi:hypothetical protein
LVEQGALIGKIIYEMQKMGLEDYSVISEILMSVNDENELENNYNEDPGFGQDLRVLK